MTNMACTVASTTCLASLIGTCLRERAVFSCEDTVNGRGGVVAGRWSAPTASPVPLKTTTSPAFARPYPVCRGLIVDELQHLDISANNFADLYDGLANGMTLPVDQTLTDRVKQQVTDMIKGGLTVKALLLVAFIAAAIPPAHAEEAPLKKTSSATGGTYVGQTTVGWHWYNEPQRDEDEPDDGTVPLSTLPPALQMTLLKS